MCEYGAGPRGPVPGPAASSSGPASPQGRTPTQLRSKFLSGCGGGPFAASPINCNLPPLSASNTRVAPRERRVAERRAPCASDGIDDGDRRLSFIAVLPPVPIERDRRADLEALHDRAVAGSKSATLLRVPGLRT